MSGLIERHVTTCTVTFKPVNSFEGLDLRAEGCKAGSLGYTWEQTEVAVSDLSYRYSALFKGSPQY